MAFELPHLEILALIAVPALAAVAAALLGPQRRPAIRWIAVVASCLTLLVAVSLTARFMHLTLTQTRTPSASAGKGVPTFRPEFVPGAYGDDKHSTSWDLLPVGKSTNRTGAIQFFIGIDGLNIWLILLTAVLMLPSVLISWSHIAERVNEYYAWLLLLQTACSASFYRSTSSSFTCSSS